MYVGGRKLKGEKKEKKEKGKVRGYRPLHQGAVVLAKNKSQPGARLPESALSCLFLFKKFF